MSEGPVGPITIHLMRHAATGHPGRLLGHTDRAATAASIARCAQAAEMLTLEAIVSSDLVRASATADPIALARGLTVRADCRWRELDFGAWDDQRTQTIDPFSLGRFWKDPDAYPPPGGERWSALIARVGDALASLGDATLVVTHGGAIRAALAATCGFDARQVWAFHLPYAAVLTLQLWRGPSPAAQITALRM